MNQKQLRELLEAVKDGTSSPGEALEQLEHMPFEDLGFAKVDHHRALRHGMPEVVLARGKTTEEVREISRRLLERSPNLVDAVVVPEQDGDGRGDRRQRQASHRRVPGHPAKSQRQEEPHQAAELDADKPKSFVVIVPAKNLADEI